MSVSARLRVRLLCHELLDNLGMSTHRCAQLLHLETFTATFPNLLIARPGPDLDHLTRALRRGLRYVPLRPDLIDGCLAGTCLSLARPVRL
ncbi:hypothetical protein ABZV67_38695 [Streptomyces sp. NPDC005065]|uniref:hypothetical protein n=1 Tax=unclassified Streptomyces TaxID=2593676 RepID=UPI0033AF4693